MRTESSAAPPLMRLVKLPVRLRGVGPVEGVTKRSAVVLAVVLVLASACAPVMRPGVQGLPAPVRASAPVSVLAPADSQLIAPEDNRPPDHAAVSASALPSGGVKLDFDAVDVREFAQAVCDSLHLSYVLAPGVSGTITTHTGQTLAGVQLYTAFREILRANRYDLRSSGAMLVIAPARSDESPDAKGIYVYNVRCGLASNLSKLVETLLYKQASRDSSASSADSPSASGVSSSAHPAPVPTSTPADRSATPTLVADDTRNVVLLDSTPSEHARIVKVLEQLDVPPRQVLIDVLVAEVTLGHGLNFGVEWALKHGQIYVGQTPYAPVLATNFANLSAAATGGLTATLLSTSADPVAVLNALSSQTDVSLVSSPQIFVENNQQATVNVGDRVPVVVSETNQTAVATPTVDRQVQYFDTGTILKVTPRINYDGMVDLSVDQQVSQATQNQTSSINSPVISTRSIQTKLSIRDGQPVILGGLISRNVTRNENRVPFLADLPGLGQLFRYNANDEKRTELLVMLTPHVVYANNLEAFQAGYESTAHDLRSRLGHD